jgi:hypothetical protein
LELWAEYQGALEQLSELCRKWGKGVTQPNSVRCGITGNNLVASNQHAVYTAYRTNQ